MGRRKQSGEESRDAQAAAPSAQPAGLTPKRRSTPDERRAAVEAFEKSGLTQAAFARQWGISHVTLGMWVRRHRTAGPRGLERLAEGPPKRRGKAPLPAALKAEIVAAQQEHPTFGWKRLKAWLWRFVGVQVSRSSVARVVKASGVEREVVAPKRRRRQKAKPPRRFERARAGELWQTDITYLDVPWRKGPLYLIAFLDDFSRYVVGWGLFTHMRQEIALETFQEAAARFGKPQEVLSDQGRQYHAWRGKSAFTRMLDKEGVEHVRARAQHPETVGKCERFWKTVKQELWERVHPKDLEEARERLRHFVGHYNHQRPHQGLEGMVPADRFFDVASEVRKAIELSVAKNALRLALGEAPRRPVFLVGQIDGQSVSVHGEAGRIVVQTPDGAVKEIEAKDLGMGPRPVPKEVRDGKAIEERADGDGGGGGAAGADDRSDDGEPGCAGAVGDAGGGPGGLGGAAAGSQGTPAGLEAHEIRAAGADAGAGARAVAERERGGAGEGAPDGHDGAEGLAGQDEPRGGGG
jgi:transposase InsO family protein